MSVQEGLSDIGYCDPADVAVFFEQYDTFGSTTDPTVSYVDNLILQWSDYIDQKTGHAWRARQVVNEFHDLDTPYYYWAGKPLKLMKREIREFKTAQEKADAYNQRNDLVEGDLGYKTEADYVDDSIEIWRGSGYQNLVTQPSFDQGRDGDYWVDGPNGILYIYRRLVFPRTKGIKVSYTYGHGSWDNDEKTIPHDIKQACAKLVASDLLRSDQYGMTVPGNDGAPQPSGTAERWEEEAEQILQRRNEVKTFGTSGF